VLALQEYQKGVRQEVTELQPVHQVSTTIRF
jgi:hypothetical protein